MTFENIIDMQVGSTKVESAWFNERQVWPTGDVWYGVKFTGSTTTGERTGNLEYHKTLPLQSQMRGCTITGDGVVKWLNSTDWTKYEDGTAIDSTLNVMVYVPDYYIKFIHNEEEDSDEVRISAQQFDDAVLLKGGYCSAYEAYNDNGTLKSIKGVRPSVSISRANFENYAKANGDNWHAYTYTMHKAITWLFVVEYAQRNGQATYNAVLTSEGYHQGGLGNGVTTGTIVESGTTIYNFVPCGISDNNGNNTGVTEFTTTTADATNRTVQVPRYRGIENPFGHIWKNTVDTICTDTTTMWITTNTTKFAVTSAPDSSDSDWRSITKVGSNGYIKALSGNGELAPSQISGSVSTYYCDYYYQNSGINTILLGGASAIGAHAGWFYLLSNYSVGYSGSGVGCRLIYLA